VIVFADVLKEAIASVSFCGVVSYMFTVSSVATSHSTVSTDIATLDQAVASLIKKAEAKTPCAFRSTARFTIQSEEETVNVSTRTPKPRNISYF